MKGLPPLSENIYQIFANDICDKGLLFKIYRELLQFNSKKKKKPKQTQNKKTNKQQLIQLKIGKGPE